MSRWRWILDREPIIVMLAPVILIALLLGGYLVWQQLWGAAALSAAGGVSGALGAGVARREVHSTETLREQDRQSQMSELPATHLVSDATQEWETHLQECETNPGPIPPPDFEHGPADA